MLDDNHAVELTTYRGRTFPICDIVTLTYVRVVEMWWLLVFLVACLEFIGVLVKF